MYICNRAPPSGGLRSDGANGTAQPGGDAPGHDHRYVSLQRGPGNLAAARPLIEAIAPARRDGAGGRSGRAFPSFGKPISRSEGTQPDLAWFWWRRRLAGGFEP